MKVLHVINSLAAGGAEKLVSELVTEQSKTIPVGLFIFNSEANIFEDLIGEKVELIKNKQNNFFSFKTIKLLHKSIKKYDVIHVHLFPAFYLVACLSMFHPKKHLIYTEHNTYNRRRRFYFWPFDKWVYSRYQMIVCISNGVYHSLTNWIGKRQKKIIIPNFVNLDTFQKKLSDSNLITSSPKNIKKIVMVGSFSDQKDQKAVIDILKFLDFEYEVIFIGDGVNIDKLKQYAQQFEFKERVKFLGVQREVPYLLKQCNYGILSSKWEGFGIAAIEYMAAEIVCLATNVSGLNELVLTKENLIEVGDAKAFADRIIEIENNPELKKQILEIQSKTVGNFSLTNATKRHLDLYKTIIGV